MIKKIFFLFLLSLLWFDGAKAFSISPLKYVLTVAPQASETLELTIKNDQLTSQNYNLKVFGAKQNAQGKLIFDRDINQAEKWVRPESESVQIDPNGEATVKFLIKIPRTAESGSYFLGLTAENTGAAGQGVKLSGQLICVLLLQVAGQVQESLDTINWQAEKIIINKVWNFDLFLKNSGSVELPLQSRLIIKNWRDTVVYDESLNLGLLLPQADRILKEEIKPAEGKFMFSGPYQATLQLIYGRTGQIKVLTTDFWRISPVGLIVLSLLAIILLIWLLKVKNKLVIKLKKYLAVKDV